MPKARWLRKEASCGPQLKFACIELIAIAVIERARHNDHVPVIWMRMSFVDCVRRPAHELDMRSMPCARICRADISNRRSPTETRVESVRHCLRPQRGAEEQKTDHKRPNTR